MYQNKLYENEPKQNDSTNKYYIKDELYVK